jgi:hypothetical protein
MTTACPQTAHNPALLCFCATAGVSGKVAFDKNGDLVATDETYVFGKHSPKGGIMVENFIDTTNDGVKVGTTAAAASTTG